MQRRHLKTHKQDHYVCFDWTFVLPVLLLNKHVVERYMFATLQCNFLPKFNLLFWFLGGSVRIFGDIILGVKVVVAIKVSLARRAYALLPTILRRLGEKLGCVTGSDKSERVRLSVRLHEQMH